MYQGESEAIKTQAQGGPASPASRHTPGMASLQQATPGRSRSSLVALLLFCRPTY